MLLDSIRTQLDSLSKSERKVALAVLDSPRARPSPRTSPRWRRARRCPSRPWCAFAARSATTAGTSSSSSWRRAWRWRLPARTSSRLQDDLAADLVNKICSRSINTLLDLRNNLEPRRCRSALDILSRANKIEFYGQGTLRHRRRRRPAQVLPLRRADRGLCRPAYPCDRGGAAATQAMPWWRSRSAATARRWCAAAKLARRGGADVIVLAPSGTPLADMATVLMPIDLVFNIDPYTPISARLAHLVVIDMLAVGLALQRGPEFRKQDAECAKGAAGIRHAVRLVHRLSGGGDCPRIFGHNLHTAR